MSEFSYSHSPATPHGAECWTVNGMKSGRGLVCVFSERDAIERMWMLYDTKISAVRQELDRLQSERRRLPKMRTRP